jgi:hypothetical protein
MLKLSYTKSGARVSKTGFLVCPTEMKLILESWNLKWDECAKPALHRPIQVLEQWVTCYDRGEPLVSYI